MRKIFGKKLHLDLDFCSGIYIRPDAEVDKWSDMYSDLLFLMT